MESNFVDYVKIYCRSGKGGKGSMHLKHVKYNPNGGPDGGDGGKGGSIILRGNHNYWTLLHLKYERHVFAEHGGNGGRDKCHGTDGKDVYIDVPCGTVVYNAETGKYICDVTYDGQEVLLQILPFLLCHLQHSHLLQELEEESVFQKPELRMYHKTLHHHLTAYHI